MKKIREYYVCDRCKKEYPGTQLIVTYDYEYRYDLCVECKKVFDKYEKDIELAKAKIDRISENYKFGKYLPKDSESKGV